MRKPWLVDTTLEFIDNKINKDSVVFEWGSGSSTIWFAERVEEVYSIECDIDVAKDVEAELFEKKMFNVNIKYRAAEKVPENLDLNDPMSFASNEDGYEASSFGGYVLIIDGLKRFYDFVAVDGRARLSCIFHARKWVKPGGWMMLDDSERAWYSEAVRLMQDSWPEPVVLAGRDGKTTHFWQKPMG